MKKQPQLTSLIIELIIGSFFLCSFSIYGQETKVNKTVQQSQENFYAKILSPVNNSIYSCESKISFKAQLFNKKMEPLDPEELTFVWFVNDSVFKIVDQFSQKFCKGSYKINLGVSINGTYEVYFDKIDIKVTTETAQSTVIKSAPDTKYIVYHGDE